MCADGIPACWKVRGGNAQTWVGRGQVEQGLRGPGKPPALFQLQAEGAEGQ